MKDLLKTLTIVLLALGLMGIILGISVGLYRNDALARMQAMGADVDSDEQALRRDNEVNGPVMDESNKLNNVLLWSNLHTILLAAGMVLTILSVSLFLIGLKKTIK